VRRAQRAENCVCVIGKKRPLRSKEKKQVKKLMKGKKGPYMKRILVFDPRSYQKTPSRDRINEGEKVTSG